MPLIYVSKTDGTAGLYATFPAFPREGQEVVAVNSGTATAYRIIRSTMYPTGTYSTTINGASVNVDGRVEAAVLPDGGPPGPPP